MGIWHRRLSPIELALGTVDRSGIDQSRVSDSDGAIALNLPKETALEAFVASSADLFDLEQDRIGVAVDTDLQDPLLMAARFPFPPQLSTAPAVVSGVARRHRFLPSFPIHPGHHQDASALGVLRDRRQ